MFGALTNKVQVEKSGNYLFYFENVDVEVDIIVYEYSKDESDYSIDVINVTDKNGEDFNYDYNKTVELITSLI